VKYSGGAQKLMKTAEWRACVRELHQFSIAFSTGENSPLRQLIDTSLTTNTHLARNSPSVVLAAVVRNIFFALAAAIIFIWSVVNFSLALETHLAAGVAPAGVVILRNLSSCVRKNFLSSLAERALTLTKCAAQQFKTWS
jgi:hypothetical protein